MNHGTNNQAGANISCFYDEPIMFRTKFNMGEGAVLKQLRAGSRGLHVQGEKQSLAYENCVFGALNV